MQTYFSTDAGCRASQRGKRLALFSRQNAIRRPGLSEYEEPQKRRDDDTERRRNFDERSGRDITFGDHEGWQEVPFDIPRD